MKKIYSLLVAAAMVLGATSCQQEAIEEVAANEPASFTATLNATRTELGEGNKVMWNADDKITIYTQENLAGVTFDGDATAAASTATFTTTAEFTASDNGYFAVYPYGKTNWSGTTVPAATYADGVWSVPTYISEEQTGVIGSFDEAYNYMAAYSTSNKLSFKAATALIKFTYTGSQGYVGFNAQGASLCGENTMNYNTETGKITYSDEGSYTSIYLNDLVKGETYYIAIYPGKVSNFNIKEGWQTTLFSYDKEYTFEAGKIYSIKMGEPSQWQLYGLDGTMTPMFIEDGYHVAKNVAYNESSYVFQNTVSYDMLTCAEEVAPRTWQATVAATESGFMTNCDYADVYLTADLSKMCVVPAGEAIPSMYHIYVYNSSEWNPLNLYVWDAGGKTLNGGWPGTALTTTMVGEVEYYVYDIPNEYIGKTVNFIVNNGAAQTADLSTVVNGDVYYYSNGDVVEDPANPVVAVSHKIYVKNSAGWSKIYLYGWNGLGTGGWPGVQLTQTETINGTTYYYYEFTGLGDVTGGSIIFNNGSGSQTGDITGVNLTADLFYEVKGTGSNYTQIADPRQ